MIKSSAYECQVVGGFPIDKRWKYSGKTKKKINVCHLEVNEGYTYKAILYFLDNFTVYRTNELNDFRDRERWKIISFFFLLRKIRDQYTYEYF